jgi:hydroxyethylthiazole kinase-like uncharacterized protein yjeF
VECIGAPEMRCDPVQPELMFRTLATIGETDVIVAGCGLGTDAAARTTLHAVLERKAARVLDADALNLIAADQGLRAKLEQSTRGTKLATVLTPHPLEAARLLGCSAAQVQDDRVAAARQLARATGATVVLKGAGSVIATPDERAWINATGGPALATPGTGDALAGILGALLAQGFDPIEAVLAGVYLHGAAAEDFVGDMGLVAGEVAELSVRRLQRLRRERAR